MVRLNDGAGTAIAQETIDALRRRYIRQNRELAKTNSLQAQRIHDFEVELARVAGQNHTMRAEIIGLERRANIAETMVENMVRTKTALEDKLAEVRILIGALGDKPEHDCSDNENTSRERESEMDRERDREARDARFEMMLDRMPTIDENQEFNGVPLDQTNLDDISAHLLDDYVQDDIVEGEDLSIDQQDPVDELQATVMIDPLQLNLDFRSRRKESKIVVYNEAEAESEVMVVPDAGLIPVQLQPIERVVALEPVLEPTKKRSAAPARKRKRAEKDKIPGDITGPEPSNTDVFAHTLEPRENVNTDEDVMEDGRKKKHRTNDFTPSASDDRLVEDVIGEKENMVGNGMVILNVFVPVSNDNGPAPRRALSQKNVNEARRETNETGGKNEKKVGDEKPKAKPKMKKGSKKRDVSTTESENQKLEHTDNTKLESSSELSKPPTIGEKTASIERIISNPAPLKTTQAEPPTSDIVVEIPPSLPFPTRSRRTRTTINYAEPSLIKKLRRPDDGSEIVNTGLLLNDPPGDSTSLDTRKHGDVRRKSALRAVQRGDLESEGGSGGVDGDGDANRVIEEELDRQIHQDSSSHDRRDPSVAVAKLSGRRSTAV